jgi:Domain of unknown function (DUF4328)/Protein of unknown function (DUF2510)
MTTEGNGEGGLPAAGWYPDAANPGRERLWTGERWIEWIRPTKVGRTEDTPAGWYPDTGHPGFERLWSGEMWTEEIRRTGALSAPPPVPAATSVPPGVSEGGAGATQPPGLAPRPLQGAQLAPIPRATVIYHDDNPPFRLGGLGLWVVIALIATSISAVAQLIADQIHIGVLNDVIDGHLPSISHYNSTVHAVHVTHAITLILECITAILFVTWFYRAYRNLVRVGISDLRFGPGWAVGGWFIPIFNLVRQKQIANDIWKASSSAETHGLARWREMPLWGVLNWWWGIWIAAGVLGAFGSFHYRHHDASCGCSVHSYSDIRTALWFAQFGFLFLIAAAVLAILFVREVSRLQDDHFEARVPGSY